MRATRFVLVLFAAGCFSPAVADEYFEKYDMAMCSAYYQMRADFAAAERDERSATAFRAAKARAYQRLISATKPSYTDQTTDVVEEMFRAAVSTWKAATLTAGITDAQLDRMFVSVGQGVSRISIARPARIR